MDCEVLISDQTCLKGRRIIDAMIGSAEVAGVNILPTRTWQKRSKNLMSYGLGHPVRREWTRAHVRKGGRLIGWDLGYWDRQESMRLTIDDDHPHKWLTPEPDGRWRAANIPLREDADPRGFILLCGLGVKQRSTKSLSGQEWELAELRRLRAAYPDRQIIYRPKRPELALPRTPVSVGTPIAEAMKGASLVVCMHSNVAVDACIAGIPVECSDGAAFALYKNNPQPTREQRLAFLQSLAYWQWKPSEAVQAWQFIKARLSA